MRRKSSFEIQETILMNDEIKCPKCQSTKVTKSPGFVGVRPIPMELVDDWSREADDSMGKETLYFIYLCSACGKEFYEEVTKNLVS
jgi:DNA-directed RNA polymerase subunit RPC12/RpoP